jgi:hypothetical protein
MRDDFPTEETIRQYLLGRLDDQPDVEGRLSEQIFLTSELSAIVDSIEDQIIEEYVDGRVSAADKRAIEKCFLRPPERQEKLQSALFLRQHFENRGQPLAKKKLNAGPEATSELMHDRSATPVILHWRSHFRSYCELAAAILLVALVFVYMSRINHGWQSRLDATRENQRQLESELALERQHSVNLEKQLEQVHPPVAVLTFFGPAFRDNADASVVEIKPWTQRIRVEIGLRGKPSGDYDVRLEDEARKNIWSQSKIAMSSGRLRFDMPIEGISTGTYCLIVSSRREPYCFQARTSKN